MRFVNVSICYVEIGFTVLISMIKSYFEFAFIVIQNKEKGEILQINVSDITDTSKQLLSMWITLTPGTIAIKHTSQLLYVHSLCGNVQESLNAMEIKARKWETQLRSTPK